MSPETLEAKGVVPPGYEAIGDGHGKATDFLLLGVIQMDSCDRLDVAVKRAIADQAGGTDLIIRKIREERIYFFFGSLHTVHVDGTIMKKVAIDE